MEANHIEVRRNEYLLAKEIIIAGVNKKFKELKMKIYNEDFYNLNDKNILNTCKDM